MKTGNKLFAILTGAAILFLSGCVKDGPVGSLPGDETLLSASFSDNGPESKAGLIDGGTTIYWDKADEIKVFKGRESAKFTSTNADLQIQADFTGTLYTGSDTDKSLYAIYPYSADASCTDGIITAVLPSEQSGTPGTFAKGTNIAVAKTQSSYLSFYNLNGGVRFSLTRNDIKEVVLEGRNGEVLAGKVKIGFNGSIPKVTGVLDGKTSITLKAPDGGTFEPGKWYYMTALPATLSKGFTLTLYTEEQHAAYTSSSTVTLARSCFGSLKDVDSGLSFGTGEVTSPLDGKWYLGYWVNGSMCIKFNGAESIDIHGEVLTWAGQQESSGNGDYSFSYDEANSRIIVSRAGSSNVFYIKNLTDGLLVLQEGAAGPLRYWYKSAEAATNAPEPEINVSGPGHPETNDIEVILSYRNGATYSSKTPMGIYYENRPATTESGRAWLADPDNEPDYSYANSNPNYPSLKIWKKFGVTLYPFGDPLPADVNQHAIGDCCFCSVMSSLSYLYPDYIKHIIKDNGDGTFTVGMYDPQGNPVDVAVNSNFLCEASGTIAQVTGKDYVPTWSTVLEKALMKWETHYKVSNLWGIGTEIAAPILTGDGRSYAFSPNSLWNSEWKKAVEWVLSNGMISVGGFTTDGLQCGALTSVSAHAFAFMLTSDTSGAFLFSMRNPWGITSVDGILEIPDSRRVVSTIDMRYVYPGAAEKYRKLEITPYCPPSFTPFTVESSVSKEVLMECGYSVK